MKNESPHVPFSQRHGYSEAPPQLKLGEASPELRRLFDYYVGLEISREQMPGVDYSYFSGKWLRVSQDIHVLFFNRDALGYENNPFKLRRALGRFFPLAKVGLLFDFVEFLVRHPGCSSELKEDLAGAFAKARAAYRIMDDQIVAIGTEQQGAAFEAAIAATETHGADAARTHLIAAGKELRDENWAGSVRESIHAVEAMARKLVPGTKALSPALSKLAQEGHLHGSLKKAFDALYGYSSDEHGVRHALVFEKEAQVDEADALFMLGACASFVTYLIFRDQASGNIESETLEVP